MLIDAATLGMLRARAMHASPQWLALRRSCQQLLPEPVVLPGDNATGNALTEGYQGSDFAAAVENLGLCYQITRTVNAATADQYARKGVSVLMAMSVPAGQHGAVSPLRDDGYGIRFYGVGMAIGYDWLNDHLDAASAARLRNAMLRWLGDWERPNGTFEYVPSSPNGNYFAGYFAAKALAASALDGTDGAQQWQAFQQLYHRSVQPYYARNLAGGGWSEGWNYGPLATINMVLGLDAVRSARGLDALSNPRLFPWVTGTGHYLLETSWPNRVTAEDFGVAYEGVEVPRISPSVLLIEAAMLRRVHDRLAPALRHLASDVLRQDGNAGFDAGSAWLAMLYDDPAAAHSTYAPAPLSYIARGLEEVAVRSSWRGDALYADFVGGPWVGFAGSGEELFAKGSIVVTNGRHPLLVNVPAQLMRTIPGTQAAWDNQLYAEQFADSGQRGIYNILYAGSGPAAQPGDHSRADGDHAAIVAYHDAGTFVLARAAHLEQGFPRFGTGRNLRRWARTMLVLRPDLVLIYDQSTVAASAAGQQRVALHLGGLPRLVGVGAGGTSRYDVAGAGGGGYIGSVDVVLPLGHHEAISNVFGSSKAWRLDVRPGVDARVGETWLSVINAAAKASQAAAVTPLSASGAEAVQIHTPGKAPWLVAYARLGTRRISFTGPGGAIRILITGLVADAHYALSVTRTPRGRHVVLRAARTGHLTADATGTILI